MLAKLENFYLDILRIVTLLIATAALIAFAVALFNARGIVATLSPAPPPPISRDAITFEHYLDETHPPAAENDATAESGQQNPSALPLREAARQLLQYFRRTVCRGNCYGTDANLDTRLEAQLRQARDGFDAPYQADYEASILAFATALNGSTDRRLTQEDFSDAILWHDANFQAAITAVTSERDLAKQQAWAAAWLAAGCIATFLIVIFFFVLVKIERNLRLVRTQQLDAT